MMTCGDDRSWVDVIEHASRRAKKLVASGAALAVDSEDLRQDLLVDFLRREPQFDPARGSWVGFLHGIMEHQSAVLFARSMRLRCREVLVDDFEQLEARIYPASISADLASLIELKVDVQRVLTSLPEYLRDVAHFLSRFSVMETCARTDRSRSAAYKSIRKLRQAFVAAGVGVRPGNSARRRERDWRVNRPSGRTPAWPTERDFKGRIT
jgi:RNA polymerase sigma-70 factor (ECF subfamily)